MGTTSSLIGMFITFLHLAGMLILGAGGFGLIKLGARPGIEPLKIAGYGLCAVAVTSMIGVMLNFIVTTFLVGAIGFDGVQYWGYARGIIGQGIDILGFAAFAYGAFTAAKA